MDQAKKNPLHHSSRMFSIKGVLVWSLLLYLDTPLLSSFFDHWGDYLCFLKFSLLRSTINPPPKKILKVKLFWFHEQNKCTPCGQHNVCNSSGTDFPSYVSLISRQMPPIPSTPELTLSPQAFFFPFLLHLEWDWCCVCFPHTLQLCAFCFRRQVIKTTRTWYPPLTRVKNKASSDGSGICFNVPNDSILCLKGGNREAAPYRSSLLRLLMGNAIVIGLQHKFSDLPGNAITDGCKYPLPCDNLICVSHKTARRRFCFLEPSENKNSSTLCDVFSSTNLRRAAVWWRGARLLHLCCRYCRSDPDDNNKSDGIYKEKVSICSQVAQISAHAPLLLSLLFFRKRIGGTISDRMMPDKATKAQMKAGSCRSSGILKSWRYETWLKSSHMLRLI